MILAVLLRLSFSLNAQASIFATQFKPVNANLRAPRYARLRLRSLRIRSHGRSRRSIRKRSRRSHPLRRRQLGLHQREKLTAGAAGGDGGGDEEVGGCGVEGCESAEYGDAVFADAAAADSADADAGERGGLGGGGGGGGGLFILFWTISEEAFWLERGATRSYVRVPIRKPLFTPQ